MREKPIISVTLSVMPLTEYDKGRYCLRLRKPDGTEICYYDPERANHALKAFFGFRDEEIAEYLGLEI
jgi:hypothetical protein